MNDQENQGVQICLEKTSAWLMEHCAVYSLFAQSTDGEQARFSMQVSMDGEVATLFLGCRLELALRIFHQMVHGSVPPCVLEEMFCDMIHTAMLELEDAVEKV